MIALSMIPEWYNVEKSLAEQEAFDKINAAIDRYGKDSEFALILGGFVNGLVDVTLEICGAFLDVLSIGAGIGQASTGENPAMGIFADGMRLLALVGPVAKGVQVFGPRLLPRLFAEAEPSVLAATIGECPLCTPVSAATALRLTNALHFATVGDLARAMGIPLTDLTKMSIGEVLPVLRKLQAVCDTVAAKSLGEIEGLAKAAPQRVHLVDLTWAAGDWGEQAHTVAVQWSRVKQCVMWYDPSGAMGNTLKAIEKEILQKNPAALHFTNFANATPRAVAWVENARYLPQQQNLRNLTSVGILANIALQVGYLFIPRSVPIPIHIMHRRC